MLLSYKSLANAIVRLYLHSLQYLPKPYRKHFWMELHFRLDAFWRCPAVVVGFCGVGQGSAVPYTYIYMVNFVLGKPVVELGGVVESEGKFQVAVEAHFVLQTFVHVGFHVLAFDKMAATGICPQSARVVFGCSSSLH